MRLNKLLIMGIVSMSLMGTANAAVYGTLKTDVDTGIISKDTMMALQKGELVKIVEKQDKEYIIAFEDNVQQAVKIEDIKLVGNLTFTLTENTKLREKAKPTADIINFLQDGDLVLVEERQDDFYKVKVNNQEGYIYKGQISEKGLEDLTYTKSVPVVIKKESQVKGITTSVGSEVATYAKRYVGGRYVYGGNSLTNGVDCSGFTQQIMKRFGVSIARSSRAQYASSGSKVSAKEILPGDLVYYGSNGKSIDHTAIYIGNGQIVHASDARSGIKVSKLYYGKPLIGIKRVLN